MSPVVFVQVNLPSCKNLFTEDAQQKIPRQTLEHFMQGLLRMLSAMMMTSYPPRVVSHKESKDGWEVIGKGDLEKVQMLKTCKRTNG